jgi:nicotinate phosphoribosyltransferase
MSDINVYGFLNSEFVLPNEPILTLEGSLAKVQIIESTLLNLTNYPTLISSLALRLRMISGLENKILVEDGCKHAQTSNGALMGVKYSMIGGVDYSTFLLSSKKFHLDLFHKTPKIDEEIDINSIGLSNEYFIYEGKNLLEKIIHNISEEEYSKIKDKLWKKLYPLIMTIQQKQFAYEVSDRNNLDEEILLFVLCCLAVKDLNLIQEYIFLANYLNSISQIIQIHSKLTENLNNFNLSEILKTKQLKILIRYDSSILNNYSNIDFDHFDGLLLGTEFTVSQTHPALGMVYKINEINNKPCLKFSEEKEKQTIPGNKKVLRLFDENSNFVSDVLCLKEEVASIMESKEIEV